MIWHLIGLVALIVSLSPPPRSDEDTERGINVLPEFLFISKLPDVAVRTKMSEFWVEQLVDAPLMQLTPNNHVACDSAYVDACSLLALVDVPEVLAAAKAWERPEARTSEPSADGMPPRARLAYGLTLWGLASGRSEARVLFGRKEPDPAVPRLLWQAERFLRPAGYPSKAEPWSATGQCRAYALLAHALVLCDLKWHAGEKELKALASSGSLLPPCVALSATSQLASMYEVHGEKELARAVYSTILTRFVAFRDWATYSAAREALDRLSGQDGVGKPGGSRHAGDP